ncbi:hypothetical protein [Desulfosporosinus burensis]
MWRKARSVATKYFFGVGGSAILSTGHYRAFRISNTEVKNPHCRSVRYKLQCGERLPFATKYSFGVGGSAILSTGDYRAFRSRADDTWGIAPGKVGSTLQEPAL